MPTYSGRAAVPLLAMSVALMLSSQLAFAQGDSLIAAASVVRENVAGTSSELEAERLPSAPQPVPSTIEPAKIAPIVPVETTAIGLPGEIAHRFWDRKDVILFAAVGATATADFFITRANLANGGKELNPLTRPFSGSTAGLATNFGLETAGVMGISYIFHKTGHHKLERLTSLVDIGGSLTAVGYGLSHR